METAIIVALIAASGAVAVGFLANIVAEDYRRHRDSCALAGALAGELASYKEAWPILNDSLKEIKRLAESDIKFALPEMPKPIDRIFEANVGRIGLLGPDLAEDLAYVYNNLEAFRGMFKSLMDGTELTSNDQAVRVAVCITTLNRCLLRGEDLPGKLRKFSKASYRPFIQISS